MTSSGRNNLIIGIVIGLILGLLLGLLFGYVISPVEYTDAQSYHLDDEGKATYVTLVAASFEQDKDKARAEAYLEFWEPEELQQAFGDAKQRYEAEGRADVVQSLDDLATVMGVSPAAAGPEEPLPAEEEAPTTSLWDRVKGICLVFVVVLLVLILGWIGYRQAMKRRQAQEPEAVPMEPLARRDEEWDGVSQPPLGHFFTTYQLGEDTYDESFSIETPMGEFLGECGMGISETIGVGDPDKVTAFEVWLFDKSDIRTVTKVLMSEYAYNDEALRAKLVSKGEAVVAQPGSPIILETSSLKVKADVTELAYGEGEDVPPQSFFQKLTVELVATAKPAEADTSEI